MNTLSLPLPVLPPARVSHVPVLALLSSRRIPTDWISPRVRVVSMLPLLKKHFSSRLLSLSICAPLYNFCLAVPFLCILAHPVYSASTPKHSSCFYYIPLRSNSAPFSFCERLITTILLSCIYLHPSGCIRLPCRPYGLCTCMS